MDNPIITSEPPAKSTPKTKKRKMSAAARKIISDAAKARWAKKKLPADVDRVDYYRQNNDGTYSLLKGGIDVGQGLPSAPIQPAAAAPPSPAVLALQEQVVHRVSQRDEVRQRLTEAHTAYLLAQSRFQAAEAELKGIEQEVNYRIGLIAQLENRPQMPSYAPAPVLQMPNSLAGVTSEPAQPSQPHQAGQQQRFATGDAGDLRRELRGMM